MKLKQISFQILVVFHECETNLKLKKWHVKVKKKSTTYKMVYYDWHHNKTQWNEILVVEAFIWCILMRYYAAAFLQDIYQTFLQFNYENWWNVS